MPDPGNLQNHNRCGYCLNTLLNAQGLLDSTAQKAAALGYSKGTLNGHSLGAWRANNLVSQGFFKEANLMSLPALSYPTTGTTGQCGSMDIICGWGLVTALRPDTKMVRQESNNPFSMSNHFEQDGGHKRKP